MSRSSWKVPYISSNFFHKKCINSKVIKTRIRYSLIPSTFINKRILTHNGSWYGSSDVSLDMLGHKFGEFSLTKRSDTQLRLKRKTKKKSKKHK